MENEPAASGTDIPDANSAPAEAAMLSAWRRVVAPALSLPDAPALLGSSIETLRRRLRDSDVHALRDDHGRIRISATVTYLPDGAVDDEPVDAGVVAQMRSEVQALRDELDASRAEESRLQAELEAVETALQYTKAEVGNLWRVMTTRNLKQAARKAAHESHEAAKLIILSEQRARIRTKVQDMREIARRRKWPWSLVG